METNEDRLCGKGKRDEKLIGGGIRRRGGRAAKSLLLRGGRRARRCLLTRLRAKAEEPDGALVDGVAWESVTPRVDSIHPSGQQISILNGPFLI